MMTMIMTINSLTKVLKNSNENSKTQTVKNITDTKQNNEHK